MLLVLSSILLNQKTIFMFRLFHWNSSSSRFHGMHTNKKNFYRCLNTYFVRGKQVECVSASPDESEESLWSKLTLHNRGLDALIFPTCHINFQLVVEYVEYKKNFCLIQIKLFNVHQNGSLLTFFISILDAFPRCSCIWC